MSQFNVTPDIEEPVNQFVAETSLAMKRCHDEFPRRLSNREEIEDLKAGRLLTSTLFREKATRLEAELGVRDKDHKAALREVLYQRWLKALAALFSVSYVIPKSMADAVNANRRHYAELGPAEVN